MVHGVINKAYVEMLKPLIEQGNIYNIANIRVTPVT